MANKTLTELRAAVLAYYGDVDGVTADASSGTTEVDIFLKDGVNLVLSRCPWILVLAPTTATLTTDAVGAAILSVENVEQMWSVEVLDSTGDYRLLQPGHAGKFANPEYIVTDTVDQIAEYVLDGNRIQFYPVYKSDSVDVRLTFSDNAIGTGFPSSGSSKLPTSIPTQAEDAAVLYAVQKLHERDNNFEAAAFIARDVESRIVMLNATHNRPQRGRNVVVFNEDEYVLDANDGAW